MEVHPAYMILNNNVYKHLFGNGAIDVIPNLELVMEGMGWVNDKLYEYRSLKYFNFDDKKEGDNDLIEDSAMAEFFHQPDDFFFKSNNDVDDDGFNISINDDEKQQLITTIGELRHPQSINVFILICLGQLFQENYFE